MTTTLTTVQAIRDEDVTLAAFDAIRIGGAVEHTACGHALANIEVNADDVPVELLDTTSEPCFDCANVEA